MLEKCYSSWGKRFESARRTAISYAKRVVDGCFFYGELYVSDFLCLMELIKTKRGQTQKKAIFYDLGSGLGKLVIAAATLGWIEQSGGIEIIPEISNDAHAVLDQILKDENSPFLEAAKKCTFYNGDILELPHYWTKADIVYTCATGFSGSFLCRLEKMLATLKEGAFVLIISHQLNSTSFDCIETNQVRSTYGNVLVRLYRINSG